VASTDPIVRILSNDGALAPTGPAEPYADRVVALDEQALLGLLTDMVRTRAVDVEAANLQRQGHLALWVPSYGQEAAQVGSASALGDDDFVFPSFRELAVAVARDVDLVAYLQYHRGTWHGGAYDAIASRFAPICVPVATQIVHAVGWAFGAKLDGTDACSIAYFGDGSASEGDFHEAANMAAVFGAPVVLFCQNNGWAISVPTEEQYAAPIAARAAGYGIPGVRVDGNDVLAVYRVTRDALDRARRGGGPTLVEALTYRMGDHTTSDDATRYRDDREVGAWRARDPIERYRRWLLAAGHIDEGFLGELRREIEAWVAAIRGRLVDLGTPPREELFAFAYADPPPETRAAAGDD
jgi:pyruvate dehydrogenase E1 component alpha subunit